MAQGKTHYDLLGLARDASLEDIEANYRLKLAQLKGRAGVSAADVMALRGAHHALSDPARRAQYDKSLAPPQRARAILVPVAPKAQDIERSPWQSTPVMIVGILVLAGIGAWGWSNWQKKASSANRAAPRAMMPPAAAKPMPPRKPATAPSSAPVPGTPAPRK